MSMSCSIMSTAMAGSRRARRPAMSRDSAGERPAVGSSRRSRRGRPARARAISSCRCSPWERLRTIAPATDASPTESRMARARPCRSAKARTGRSMENRRAVWAWTASWVLSSTLRSGKRLVIWKVRARPWAARRWAGAVVTSRPNSVMRPELTGSAPAMRLNSVVLPAPLGPMSARRSPGRTARATPSTARRPPKCLLTPSSVRANSALMTFGRPRLAVLAWRIVSGVKRHLQELVGIVFPELAYRRIGEDHGVLELAAHPLHLAHVDVLDGIAPLVDDHRPAGKVLELHLLEGGQEGLAVLHLAVDRPDRLDDPPHVRVAGLGVVRGYLARLGLEGLGVGLVGRVVEGRGVVERGIDAEGLVSHLGQHRLVGKPPVADQRDFGLEPRLRVLLHELQ